MGPLNERGVTLIELLVVMMLLTIALASLATSFPLAMFGVNEGGNQTKATLQAQYCVDNAKAIAYSQLTVALPVVCPNGPVPGSPGFSQTLNIQQGVPSATTTTVTVTVQFIPQAGGAPTITSLATILAQ